MCPHTAAALRINLTDREVCKDHFTSYNEDKHDYGPMWKRTPDIINPYYSLDKR